MNPVLLKGKKVIGTEGYVVGEMNDLYVDFNKWQATAFYVILSDMAAAQLDFKKPSRHKIIVWLPTELIRAVGDVITLTASIGSLKDIVQKEMQLNPVKIDGKRVISAKGYIMGEVEGLEVEVSNWQVTALHVGLTDDAATELGFKRPILSKVIVVVPIIAVGAVGNFVTLDKSIEDLKSLVECIKSCQKQT